MAVPTTPSGYPLGRKSPHSELLRERIKLTANSFAEGYAATVPDFVDYMARVGTWPMYGNDRLSDCAEAAAGHLEEVWSTYGQSSLVMVTESAVIGLYEQAAGYNPADPSTDGGTVMQDMFDVWRKQGLGGHKITAFAQLDPTDKVTCKAALWYFGGLAIGVNFPRSADDQFMADQTWDYNPNADNSILGGHAIQIGAIDANGNWKGSTWARQQLITSAWWDQFVEEVWVPISLEWVNSTGSPANALKDADLNAEFTRLTKQPGPFPANPNPAPVPPTPQPPATDPDVQLVAACWPWVTSWHVRGSGADKAASALATWRRQKGL